MPDEPIEAELLAALDDDEPATREVYADWLEQRGDDARADYLRAQDALLAASDLDTFDERARHLALVAIAVDPAWRARVECAALTERIAARARSNGWMAFTFRTIAPDRSTWELPEQLRYLERLTPRTPGEPAVLIPEPRRKLWFGFG